MPKDIGSDPRPAAVTFATTEHFTLQGVRRTASGNAFYAFGLVLLPTLTFVGWVTFERTLQSGMEDLGYARRIALLRGYYFDEAPELAPYLMSVPEPQRLRVLGLGEGRWQPFRSVAAMVAVITAVLAGSAVGLVAVVVSERSLAAALVAGGVVALAALAAMMRRPQSAWERATSAPVSFDAEHTTAASTTGEVAGPPTRAGSY
jgi:hypothetical protein